MNRAAVWFQFLGFGLVAVSLLVPCVFVDQPIIGIKSLIIEIFYVLMAAITTNNQTRLLPLYGGIGIMGIVASLSCAFLRQHDHRVLRLYLSLLGVCFSWFFFLVPVDFLFGFYIFQSGLIAIFLGQLFGSFECFEKKQFSLSSIMSLTTLIALCFGTLGFDARFGVLLCAMFGFLFGWRTFANQIAGALVCSSVIGIFVFFWRLTMALPMP